MMEFHVEAHRSEWLHSMPDLWFDRAGLARLQDTLGRRGLDVEAQPAFEDMNQSPGAVLGFVGAQKGCWYRVLGKHRRPPVGHVSRWNGHDFLDSPIADAHYIVAQEGFLVLHFAEQIL
jgi:hypothetical protein